MTRDAAYCFPSRSFRSITAKPRGSPGERMTALRGTTSRGVASCVVPGVAVPRVTDPIIPGRISARGLSSVTSMEKTRLFGSAWGEKSIRETPLAEDVEVRSLRLGAPARHDSRQQLHQVGELPALQR